MYVHSYHGNDLLIKSCYMHMVATPYSVACISISGDCCAYDNDVDEIHVCGVKKYSILGEVVCHESDLLN